MGKLRTQIGHSSSERSKHGCAALPAFLYEDGYTLSATDLGKLGVKIELNHKYDTGAAIILPPKMAAECGRWLLQTLEQDSYGLPRELGLILERLSRQRGFRPTLQRGDKKKLRDALKVLKSKPSRMRAEELALRPLSKKAI